MRAERERERQRSGERAAERALAGRRAPQSGYSRRISRSTGGVCLTESELRAEGKICKLCTYINMLTSQNAYATTLLIIRIANRLIYGFKIKAALPVSADFLLSFAKLLML